MLIELLPSQDEPHPTDWERNYAFAGLWERSSERHWVADGTERSAKMCDIYVSMCVSMKWRSKPPMSVSHAQIMHVTWEVCIAKLQRVYLYIHIFLCVMEFCVCRVTATLEKCRKLSQLYINIYIYKSCYYLLYIHSPTVVWTQWHVQYSYLTAFLQIMWYKPTHVWFNPQQWC